MFIIYDQYAINLEAISHTLNLSTSHELNYIIFMAGQSKIEVKCSITNPNEDIVNLIKKIEEYIENNLY